tara:strand:- start:1207 stop:2268 length:1062 start_codon:yes stop_codon:yes gene_type:complete
MISLPEDFVILKFFELGYYPKYNKFNNVYQCSCPICREGKSLGKKRRCYYIPKNENIFCHNCGWSGKPLRWIKEVSKSSDTDIINELKEYVPDTKDILESKEGLQKPIQVETLPKDSINLSDEFQLDYYNSNNVVTAVRYLIKERRLDTAVNRPTNLYVSLVDKVHKNRLVIPFINEVGEIEFYQTRTVLNKDNKTKPKYLGKVKGEKTLFNIDKVTNDHDKVYIFEGPINAFFTKNSIAVAGITERGKSFTQRQEQQFNNTLKWFDKVWILDSQWVDQASLVKSEVLLKQSEKVFIWPEKFGKRFKDFNDIAIACKINEIKWDFIEKNTFEGLEGIVKLSEIKKYRNQTYLN